MQLFRNHVKAWGTKTLKDSKNEPVKSGREYDSTKPETDNLMSQSPLHGAPN